jgi:hypothetical protein
MKRTYQRKTEYSDNRVEILEVKTGSVRALPLVGMVRVSLARLKNEAERPREEYLLLKDDSAPLEAKNLNDLVVKLRERCSDGEYERTLHWELDHQAEQRRAQAMQGLIKILAEAAVREVIQAHEESATQRRIAPTGVDISLTE